MHSLEEIYTLSEEVADSVGQMSGPDFAADDRWVASLWIRDPGNIGWEWPYKGSYTIGGEENRCKVIGIRYYAYNTTRPLID